MAIAVAGVEVIARELLRNVEEVGVMWCDCPSVVARVGLQNRPVTVDALWFMVTLELHLGR